MAIEQSLSWKQTLHKVRSRVVEMEKHRDIERELLRERNEQGVSERLKTDTAEALTERFGEFRASFDRAVRKFFPLPHIEGIAENLEQLNNLLGFYVGCIKEFPKVFTPQHKQTIPALISELKGLRKGLDRQLGQWRGAGEATAHMVFRPRGTADDEPLVAVAKTFSDRAHSVSLSIPGDYFAHEDENFWVAESEGKVFGYMKFFPEDKVVTFALMPADKVNFNKFVRSVLHRFYTAGPLPAGTDAVRVRVGYQREAKFFTDMGFVRTQIKGPGDWIYQRKIG